MKVITKKISLEPYKSKINGSLTSYDGVNENGVTFNDYSKPEYNIENYKSKIYNYGMLPFDVICPKENCNSDEDLTLSYPTLMERYYFCKKYLKLLEYSSKCSDEFLYYENAIDYYNNTFDYKSDDLQKQYEDLESKYNEYGGIDFLNWCENILYGESVDYNYYYLCPNCDYYEESNNDNEIKSCNGKCKEIYDENNIPNLIGINSASINIPILFTNTIDDMGEYSILCNEWEEGVDYRSSDYFLGLNSEHSHGALVIYDDEIWKFKGENDDDYGSIYSKKYRELYFPRINEMSDDPNFQWYEKSITDGFEGSIGQWNNYTDLYFSQTTNDYSYKSSDIIYSVKNGKIFFSNRLIINDISFKKNMAYNYNIISNDYGFYVIDDELYIPYIKEYIIYNNEYILVHNVDNFEQLNIKYCNVKGQKLFSKTKEVNVSIGGNNNTDVLHYFIIDEVEYMVYPQDLFIIYQNNAYKIDNNTVNVNGITYNKINKYSIVDGKYYYINDNDEIITFKKNNTEYTLNNTLITDLGLKINDFNNVNNKSSGYTIDGSVLYVFKPYIEYSVDTMSGYTESKLSSFKTYDIAFDDMGNELPGRLQTSGSGENMQYIEPTDGSYLDLPYKVGTVCDLTVFGYDEDGNANEFFGNILTSITLYYVDYYGNIIEETKNECGLNESIIIKINDSKNRLETYLNKNNNISQNHYSIDKDIRCNIKYHMGAILTKNSDNVYSINEGNDGIKYEEEVKLVTKTCQYMFDEISSYILNYYEIVYNETFDKLNEYSNSSVKVGKSFFTYKIDNLFTNKHDGMIASPVFREEYKFGSSSLENIETDIYIDRGFSSSFEKHLKLLDVKSFEALEQYGNGFYNIIEN